MGLQKVSSTGSEPGAFSNTRCEMHVLNHSTKSVKFEQEAQTKVGLSPEMSHFFGTFCRFNHHSYLDFYRVLYDAKEQEKEKEKEKENDDSFLETTPPNKTREQRF